jgi:hypothetical protein
VLKAKAAELQAVDAELGQVERLLKLESSGAAGNCPSCDAPYARGAVFCWQCGHALLPVGSRVDRSRMPRVRAQAAGGVSFCSNCGDGIARARRRPTWVISWAIVTVESTHVGLKTRLPLLLSIEGSTA